MLIRAPGRELGEIVKYLLRVSVKDMGSVTVDQQSGAIIVIISISADVVPAIHNQHRLAIAASQALCRNGTRKAGSDHQIIKHKQRLQREFHCSMIYAWQVSVSAKAFLQLIDSFHSTSYPMTISTEISRWKPKTRYLTGFESILPQL